MKTVHILPTFVPHSDRFLTTPFPSPPRPVTPRRGPASPDGTGWEEKGRDEGTEEE